MTAGEIVTLTPINDDIHYCQFKRDNKKVVEQSVAIKVDAFLPMFFRKSEIYRRNKVVVNQRLFLLIMPVVILLK